MSLLSISADAKTIKGEKQGYLTGILYLAPHTSAGVGNLCPNASPGCIAACLNTAGRGVFSNVQAARIAKTQRFHAGRAAFLTELERDIAALVRKAERAHMIPVVRLNGTSDIPWENVPHDGAPNIMARFPTVQFYDYTKSARRMAKSLLPDWPRNYHLTFSRSECNDAEALSTLASGGNAAVVFATRKGDALPIEWHGYRVIDGDTSDLRFLDAAPRGIIGYVVGLYAKGKARKDTSGFVVSA